MNRPAGFPATASVTGLRRERMRAQRRDGPALGGERGPLPAGAVGAQVELAEPVHAVRRTGRGSAPITRLVHFRLPWGQRGTLISKKRYMILFSEATGQCQHPLVQPVVRRGVGIRRDGKIFAHALQDLSAERALVRARSAAASRRSQAAASPGTPYQFRRPAWQVKSFSLLWAHEAFRNEAVASPASCVTGAPAPAAPPLLLVPRLGRVPRPGWAAPARAGRGPRQPRRLAEHGWRTRLDAGPGCASRNCADGRTARRDTTCRNAVCL